MANVSVSHGDLDTRRDRIKSIDLDAQEGGDDNSLTVVIPDFKRKAENDDVYTLTAKSEDMAGNSATVTKTFSVNRFGSTYLFSAGTASIRGAYLKKAVPVTVTELNVSGIDQRNSRIDLAKDGRIGTVYPNPATRSSSLLTRAGASRHMSYRQMCLRVTGIIA